MSRRAKVLPGILHLYKLTPGDWGYLAGLIDGEGSIMFINPRRSNNYRQPRIVIANSGGAMEDWLSSLGKTPDWYGLPRGKFEGKRIVWHWRIDRVLDVKDLLLGVLPYLKTKYIKAQQALEVCEQIIQGGDVTYYD